MNIKFLCCVAFIYSFSSPLLARDLFLTSQVEDTRYEKDGVELHIVKKGFELDSLINPTDGSSIQKVAADKVPCRFGDGFFGICGNLKFTQDDEGFFQDVSALPLISDANSVKISIVRFNMHFGGNIYVPFSLLSSEVAGSVNQNKVNSLKLLDPEQGKLNLKWSFAGKYHIGGFCRFEETDRGLCSLGANLGFRYLGLEETKDQSSEKTGNKNAVGAYFEISNAWIFPIFEVGGQEKDAGQLAIKIAGTYYYQNIDDSTILFPDAVDRNGEILAFNSAYHGFNAVAALSITDKLSVQASYFKASSHDQLNSESTLAISYDF